MLHVAPKGQTAPAIPLPAYEDALLRAAFGRYGGHPIARQEAARVVRYHQHIDAGRWFLCDCRPDMPRPPALVPVAQNHIRRHEDARNARWPAHAEACDFFRDPLEQRAISLSYAAPDEREWRLARPLGNDAPYLQRRLRGVSRHVARPRLARLLVYLMTEAGLQRVGEDGLIPAIRLQVQALWTAAGSVSLDAKAPLRQFLSTSVAKLPALIQRIEQAEPGQFVHSRPHGVLIMRLSGVSEGQLFPLSGDPIPVRGRLSLCAERAAAQRTESVRPPFVAVCLIGRVAADAPVEVLSAYVHPCASTGHLMLLDSDYERQTLAQLRSVQSWLRRHRGTLVTIEKPLFDLRPPALQDAPPRPPLLPDFLVRAAGADGKRSPIIVVETMGLAEPSYRKRKERPHVEMAQVCGPVVMHDFHRPDDTDQTWRDATFWRAVRDALLTR
jgi:hypothetical protein